MNGMILDLTDCVIIKTTGNTNFESREKASVCKQNFICQQILRNRFEVASLLKYPTCLSKLSSLYDRLSYYENGVQHCGNPPYMSAS